jgi:hypothetical protein
MEEKIRLNISKTKAEYPFIIVSLFILFAGWAVHYGFFGWKGGAIWLAIFVPLTAFFYVKKKGNYFIEANKDGIGWRKDILSRYNYIPWNYMQRVDYLVFEINFKVKESGQVVSFPTSSLNDDETDTLKKYISDMVKEKMDRGEL